MKFFIAAQDNGEDVAGVIVDMNSEVAAYYAELIWLVDEMAKQYGIFMVEARAVDQKHPTNEVWILNNKETEAYIKSSIGVPIDDKEYYEFLQHSIGKAEEKTLCVEKDGVFFTMSGYSESVWSMKLTAEQIQWASKKSL